MHRNIEDEYILAEFAQIPVSSHPGLTLKTGQKEELYL